MEAVRNYVGQLAANARVSDVLDVAVIAVLMYVGLAWFRKRASRPMLLGLAALTALYLAARWFDMYLTMTMFQAGFTAILLAMIVVFQEDLRRGFAHLAASQLFSRAAPATSAAETIDALVESIAALAEQRIGALLVFEGREPIEWHVRGGVPVDGKISLPLLHSIFNPQSPGHDGAVLIDGDQIVLLGAHLPLSQNMEQLGGRGTRHASALGLSERCDALVVVVSEERGTISIAQRGTLRQVEPPELTAILELHSGESSEPEAGKHWLRWLSGDLGLKLVALLMAASLWLMFAYRVDTIQRTFVLPIEYRNVPAGWVVGETQEKLAEVTISGSERAFDALDASTLAISFDLGEVRPESPGVLQTADGLDLPAELTVRRIEPTQVRLTFRRAPAEPPAGDPGDAS